MTVYSSKVYSKSFILHIFSAFFDAAKTFCARHTVLVSNAKLVTICRRNSDNLKFQKKRINYCGTYFKCAISAGDTLIFLQSPMLSFLSTEST